VAERNDRINAHTDHREGKRMKSTSSVKGCSSKNVQKGREKEWVGVSQVGGRKEQAELERKGGIKN